MILSSACCTPSPETSRVWRPDWPCAAGALEEAASASANSEAAAAQAAANVKTAQERIERIKRSENVEGGLGKLS